MQQICKEMIERISIHNYKSILESDIRLRNLNVLIGSNGVGKSNFISFFELLKALLNQRLGNYNLERGGFDTFFLLSRHKKNSKHIEGLIDAFQIQMHSISSWLLPSAAKPS